MQHIFGTSRLSCKLGISALCSLASMASKRAGAIDGGKVTCRQGLQRFSTNDLYSIQSGPQSHIFHLRIQIQIWLRPTWNHALSNEFKCRHISLHNASSTIFLNPRTFVTHCSHWSTVPLSAGTASLVVHSESGASNLLQYSTDVSTEVVRTTMSMRFKLCGNETWTID